jgi:hypothetical protein
MPRAGNGCIYNLLFSRSLFHSTEIFSALVLWLQGRGETESCSTAASSGPIQSAHNDICMEQWKNDGRRKTKVTQRKTCPCPPLSTTDPTWTTLVINLDLCVEKAVWALVHFNKMLWLSFPTMIHVGTNFQTCIVIKI